MVAGRLLVSRGSAGLARSIFDTLSETVDVSIVKRDPFIVAGIKVVARLRDLYTVTPVAWASLLELLPDVPHAVKPHLLYGVSPQADHVASDPTRDLYTYLVGVEVSSREGLPRGFEVFEIPAQSYAMTSCEGPRDPSTVSYAYTHLREEIISRGLSRNPSSFGFELYDQTQQDVAPTGSQRFHYDIYEPLASA
jgi:predicted transcriptional regulator YdeE